MISQPGKRIRIGYQFVTVICKTGRTSRLEGSKEELHGAYGISLRRSFIIEMYADVLVPGVWWHPLTYKISAPAEIGSRVLVPMGPRNGRRLGFLSAIKENIENEIDYDVKEIIEILDDVPLLGQELWSLSEWISRQYLCSQGEILKLMCPTPIIEGSKVNDIPPLVFNPPKDGDSEHCVYEVYDNERYGRYREIIRRQKRSRLLS